MNSPRKINYETRPYKFTERKMLLSTFARICNYYKGELDSYERVGQYTAHNKWFGTMAVEACRNGSGNLKFCALLEVQWKPQLRQAATTPQKLNYLLNPIDYSLYLITHYIRQIYHEIPHF